MGGINNQAGASFITRAFGSIRNDPDAPSSSTDPQSSAPSLGIDQDAKSIASGRQSALSLSPLEGLEDFLGGVLSSVMDGLGEIAGLFSEPIAETRAIQENRRSGEQAALDDRKMTFERLKSKLLGGGSLDASDLRKLQSLNDGRYDDNVLICQLHDLAGIKEDFELSGEIPDSYRERIENVAQSEDPELRSVAVDLLARIEAEAAHPTIEPTYDKFKARFLRDGSLKDNDFFTLLPMAEAGGARIDDLMAIASLTDTYRQDEKLSEQDKARLNQLLTSKDPDLSVAAGKLTSKMAADAARPPIELTAPLPTRAEPKYERYEQQDDHQKYLLAENLTSDSQVMTALRNFSSLSIRDKMDLAQTIANKQAAIYGFDSAKMQFDPSLPGLACYEKGTVQIRLGAVALDDPARFVNAITHEQSHVYQDQMAARLKSGKISEDDPMYQTVEAWRANDKAYISPPTVTAEEAEVNRIEHQTKLRAYLSQPLEKHAFETGDYVSAEVKKCLKDRQ